uniref:Uncharacterized protein n=1 Tax=Ditylenchus dipsaci TaxID=166011 RepID=A0A915EKI5_9BILA
MVDTVIKNLDTEEKRRTDTGGDFDPIRLGRAHANLRPYGFVSALWEKMGETIIDVVLGQEAVRDLPGAGQAWVVLTACLVDQLRAETTSKPTASHQQEYEAASLAAQKLLLMRSHIQQRNQQEDQNYPQNSTSSPPKPRHSLCNCHLEKWLTSTFILAITATWLITIWCIDRKVVSILWGLLLVLPCWLFQCLNQSNSKHTEPLVSIGSRKSTPDRAVVMDRMGGRTVEVGMEGGRGSARGSQGSINRPATPSNGIMG